MGRASIWWLSPDTSHWVPSESPESSVCHLSWTIPYWWCQSAQNSGIASHWQSSLTQCLRTSTVNSRLMLPAIKTKNTHYDVHYARSGVLRVPLLWTFSDQITDTTLWGLRWYRTWGSCIHRLPDPWPVPHGLINLGFAGHNVSRVR